MNTITRCPSCAIYYQVVQADLQAAHGWLRCGQCGHVFDSTGLVLQWTPGVAVSEQPAPRPALLADDDLVADPADRFVADDSSQERHHNAPLASASASASAVAPSAELDAFEKALSSFNPKLSPSANALSLKRTRSDAANHSWVTICIAWTLALVFFLQLGFVQRHAIVASWADAGPFFRNVCQLFACQVRPLHDAQGLVIKRSEWLARDDDHVLQWTVSNTTDRPLGMSALELSLLDGPGNVVIRRVFLPSQTGSPEILAAKQSWSGELSLFVGPEWQFNDYRLQSFYP